MTDALGGMHVGSVTPAGRARRWKEGLRFGLVAAGLFAAEYVASFVIGQILGDTPSLFMLMSGVVNTLATLGMIALAFVAGRRASAAGLVGIGVVVAVGNAWWVIQFLQSQPVAY